MHVAFSTIKGLSYTYLRYKAAVSIPNIIEKIISGGAK